MTNNHKQNKASMKKLLKEAIIDLKGLSLAPKVEALKTIGSFGKNAEQYAKELILHLGTDDDTINSYATLALASIGTGSAHVISLIRKHIITSEDYFVRLRGYWILERIEI